MSTPLTKKAATPFENLTWEFSPTTADCRYRVTLTPHLKLGGERGIWNPRNALTFTRFPIVLLRPLGQLSMLPIYYKIFLKLSQHDLHNFKTVTKKFNTIYYKSLTIINTISLIFSFSF